MGRGNQGRTFEQRDRSRGELSSKEIGVGGIGLSQLKYEIAGDLPWQISVGMSSHTICPIHAGESVTSAAISVVHIEKCGEVMLLRVAGILHFLQAWQPEFFPEAAVADHVQGVAAGKDEELRAHPEAVERDLRKHGIVTACDVSAAEAGIVGNDLDEAPPPLGEERVVDVAERVEGDAVLRDEGEEGVRRIAEQCRRKKAACGGDKRRRSPLRRFRRDESSTERPCRREEKLRHGVGMNVDIEEPFVAEKESFPERSKGDVGVDEEHEGNLRRGSRSPADTTGCLHGR
ncbi:hypothetical protein HPP92_012159 [Vanilla planifolia]|uniref:Uncharacterized protein n=1 Tax=Vanilla planifolia TaxID=51239 RepID=A0A835V333_VANPL|nr:hypothetical protein HPP92_012159 [Vanilla planifolia]